MSTAIKFSKRLALRAGAKVITRKMTKKDSYGDKTIKVEDELVDIPGIGGLLYNESDRPDQIEVSGSCLGVIIPTTKAFLEKNGIEYQIE